MAETGSTDLGARVAELEERLAAVERRDRDRRRVGGLLRELVPPEARTHLRAAQREQLMAARSVLDHWIERLERPDAPHGRESIAVD